MSDVIVRSKDGNFNETYRDMGDDTFAKVVATDDVTGSLAAEYNSAPPTYSDGDDSTLQTDNRGNLKVQQAAVNNLVTIASSNDTAVTTATDTTLIAAPGAGNKIRVFYINASNTGSTTTQVMWRDGAAGARRYRTALVQYAAFGHNLKPDAWDLTEDTALYLTTSAAGNIYWTVEYSVVAV